MNLEAVFFLSCMNTIYCRSKFYSTTNKKLRKSRGNIFRCNQKKFSTKTWKVKLEKINDQASERLATLGIMSVYLMTPLRPH